MVYAQMLQGRWQPRCSLDHEDVLRLERADRRTAYGGGTAAWRRRRRLSRLSYHGHPDNQELENNTCNNTQQCHFPSYSESFPSLRLILLTS